MIVLVASIDFIEQPLYGFIRLEHHLEMSHIIAAEIPVRFLFFILAPKNLRVPHEEQIRQHEEQKQIGRVFSTMMSDEAFRVIVGLELCLYLESYFDCKKISAS